MRSETLKSIPVTSSDAQRAYREAYQALHEAGASIAAAVLALDRLSRFK